MLSQRRSNPGCLRVYRGFKAIVLRKGEKSLVGDGSGSRCQISNWLPASRYRVGSGTYSPSNWYWSPIREIKQNVFISGQENPNEMIVINQINLPCTTIKVNYCTDKNRPLSSIIIWLVATLVSSVV